MENPSCISHVSFGTNDLPRALKFYDRIMATIGCRRIMEHPTAVAYGKQFPELWIQAPFDGGRAGTANGVHVGFMATSRGEVDAFYGAAVAAGGTDDGAPGVRPDYGKEYYGCFVRDPDGHKIEAMYWHASGS